MSIDAVESVRQSVAMIQQADREAEEAMLAFTLGDFDNYLTRMVSMARSRLEERYDAISDPTARNTGESGGGFADNADSASDHDAEHAAEPQSV